MVSRLGFWSSILTAILAMLFFAIGFFGTPYTVFVPYPYIPTFFNPIDYTWLYPATLLAPTFIVLMACIHYYALDNRKIFSLIGLSFAIIYAAIILTDYFIQWTVILPSILMGETADLILFSQYNHHGLFVALEALAYLMMNTAFLFAAAVFRGGRLEHAVRWLFILSFVLAIGFFAFTSLMKYEIVLFEITVIALNCIVLIVSGILLGILFRRSGQERGESDRNQSILVLFI